MYKFVNVLVLVVLLACAGVLVSLASAGSSSSPGNLKARVAALEAQVSRLEACDAEMVRQQQALAEKLQTTMEMTGRQGRLIDRLCLCAPEECCAPDHPGAPEG